MIACDSDLVNQVSGRFGIHRHAIRNVRDLSHGADQQCGRDRNGLSFAGVIGIAEFVVQTVFTADKRRLQIDRQIVTSVRCTH